MVQEKHPSEFWGRWLDSGRTFYTVSSLWAKISLLSCISRVVSGIGLGRLEHAGLDGWGEHRRRLGSMWKWQPWQNLPVGKLQLGSCHYCKWGRRWHTHSKVRQLGFDQGLASCVRSVEWFGGVCVIVVVSDNTSLFKYWLFRCFFFFF